MADDVTLNAGSGGADLATDQTGGASGPHYQRIKVSDGTADSTTHLGVPTDGSAAMTTGLHVLGTDGTNAQIISTNTSGHVNIADGGNVISTDWNGTAPPIGAGTEAAALRVTVATDSTGVLSVDDNSGSLTVDNAGTFATQVDGDALTALQLIDNIVHVDDAGFTLGTSSGVMMMGFAGTQSVNANDAGAIAMETDGAIHIHDGGNTITIDGTVTANAGTGTLTVTDDGSFTLAANSGVDIGDVDVTSIVPGTGATNLGKAEDAAHTTGDVGVMALAVRQDSQVDFGADGDYVPFSIDANGAVRVTGGGGGTEYTEDDAAAANPVGGAVILVREDGPVSIAADGDNVAQRATQYGAAYTQIVDSSGNFVDSFGGSGGTAMVDDAAFTAGTTQGTPAFAMFDDTAPDSVNEGDGGVVRMSANRNLYSTIRDAAGNERGVNVNASNQLEVNLGASTVDVMLGTDFSDVLGTASLILGTQADGVANTSDGLQATNFNMVFNGTTWDRVREGGEAGSLLVDLGANNDVTVSGTVTVDMTTNNDVQGAVAHDSAVTGNPFLLAGEARTTLPTAVGSGDAVRLQADDDGRLVTQPWSPRDLITAPARVSLTSTTRTELISAGGANVFQDLAGFVFSNESATEVRVDFFDLTTGGTARFSVDLAADGGGAVCMLPVPFPQDTANNAWDVQLSAAVSTVYCTALFVDRQ